MKPIEEARARLDAAEASAEHSDFMKDACGTGMME